MRSLFRTSSGEQMRTHHLAQLAGCRGGMRTSAGGFAGSAVADSRALQARERGGAEGASGARCARARRHRSRHLFCLRQCFFKNCAKINERATKNTWSRALIKEAGIGVPFASGFLSDLLSGIAVITAPPTK